ncbi:hypothetical protein PISMIDRAFT_673183 [Pisolithus microcarpus 441]|uniref:Unplaced genomic scaffold scaffold_7, whole genome shotgun sequence n=1 Tax=Pisolithus microcarpus 441 TaxID=765257 RepID=A0A0D0A3D0_9AGAM|nr:hypothetical protein PISMIDRAFT_673183 [Pisolithus microcarpus 441]
MSHGGWRPRGRVDLARASHGSEKDLRWNGSSFRGPDINIIGAVRARSTLPPTLRPPTGYTGLVEGCSSSPRAS